MRTSEPCAPVRTGRTEGGGRSTAPPGGTVWRASPQVASRGQQSEQTGPAATGQSAMSGRSYAVSQTARSCVAVTSATAASGPLIPFGRAGQYLPLVIHAINAHGRRPSPAATKVEKASA